MMGLISVTNATSGYEGIGLLHSKHGGNALALDGHVDFVTTVQFKGVFHRRFGAWAGRENLPLVG